ncbi:MAG TPA: PQQ-dependent sugar dehydrogenase [Polyangiales bacterium]|nr:PQQ-dependent sugar dehydrogenase [Polyangiales bacterium]
MKHVGWIVICAVALGLCPRSTLAAPLDPEFSETLWSSGMGLYCTAMAWAPDGSNRLFVATQNGYVAVIKDGVWLWPPFATEPEVWTQDESGLIGIAFDPNFAYTGYVYLLVTVSKHEQQIVRYEQYYGTDRGHSRTVIVSGLPSGGSVHNGGALEFGPDGKLYWGIGDLGNGTGVGADLTTLAAKIGRASRNGSVPRDNPFYDGGGPQNDYVWARGFRNPFKMRFEPGKDRLWVNSVGTEWEQVFVVSKGVHAGYNAYENDQPTGYLAPAIAYVTGQPAALQLTAAEGATRSAGVATFTTTTDHGLRKGGQVTVSGVADTSFEGVFDVASIGGAKSFSVSQSGSDAVSGGGAALATDIGHAITGGTFWDSSAVPQAYRGNFMFVDWGSGALQRVTLAADGSVSSIRHLATYNSPTDVAIGPDGALYVLEMEGNVHRVASNPTTQALVVTPLHLRFSGGGSSTVTVRLAMQPAEEIVVDASVVGDPDIWVRSPLRFTPTNWNLPQRVEVLFSRLVEKDTTVTMTLSAAAAGIPAQTVDVRVIDAGPRIISEGATTVREGESGSLWVRLDRQPAVPLEVRVRTSRGWGVEEPDMLEHPDYDKGTLEITSGAVLVFTPFDWAIPQKVTIFAGEDDDRYASYRTLWLSTQDQIFADEFYVTIEDDDAPIPPMFVDTFERYAIVNAPYTASAMATGTPAPTFELLRGPAGMQLDAKTGLLTWTPSTIDLFEVEIVARNEAGNDTRAFSIYVEEDRLPQCTLLEPASGGVLRGTDAEFSGWASDDVDIARVEFTVDDRLVYAESSASEAHDFRGRRGRFDTTEYTDGAHQLGFTAYDSAGHACHRSVRVSIDNELDPATASPMDAGASKFEDAAVDSGKRDAMPPEPIDAALADAGSSSVDAGSSSIDGNVEVDASSGDVEPGEPDAAVVDSDSGPRGTAMAKKSRQSPDCSCRAAGRRPQAPSSGTWWSSILLLGFILLRFRRRGLTIQRTPLCDFRRRLP